MSNVNLAIGGRTFTVACANGEEDHVAQLGRVLDRKVSESGVIAQSETRMLLFLALMLADEVHEARRELEKAIEARSRNDGARAEMELRVDNLTRRLEALAEHLEEPGANA